MAYDKRLLFMRSSFDVRYLHHLHGGAGAKDELPTPLPTTRSGRSSVAVPGFDLCLECTGQLAKVDMFNFASKRFNETDRPDRS